MRAAIYVSGSVLDISKQTSLLVRFCKRHSITLEDDYSDFDGDTGSLRMMVAEAMLYGHFDTVVMESPDVIPERDRQVTLAELAGLGVSVVFAECDTLARRDYPEDFVDESVRERQ